MNIFNGVRENSKIYIAEADNHAYYLNRKYKNGKLYLRCRERSCDVTVIYFSTSNVILKQNETHNHQPDRLLQDKIQLKNHLKQKAQTTNRKMEEIFLEGQERFQAAALQTGDCKYYRSFMQRARNKSFGNIPTNLEQLDNSLMLENNVRYVQSNLVISLLDKSD